MRDPYSSGLRASAGARTEPPRTFEMPDRDVGLARANPEDTTEGPAAREIRI